MKYRIQRTFKRERILIEGKKGKYIKEFFVKFQ